MSEKETFAAAAGELIDEVQSTIKDDEPTEVAEQRSPWVLPGVLGIVLVGVLGWNLWLLQAASPRLSASEARHADGVLVFVATQAVEGYAAEHGRLPDDLGQVGLDAMGLGYAARVGGFEVSSARGGTPVRHDSAERVDDFMVRMGVALPDTSAPDTIR